MRRLIFIIPFFVAFCAYGQGVNNWVQSPFSDLGFIENARRYDKVMDETVLYHASYAHYTLFFTETGVIFGTQELLTLEERKAYKEKWESGEEIDPLPWHYFKLSFEQMNTETTVIPQNRKTHTFNFCASNDCEEVIVAKAYDVLIYENLYHNIDLKFELPNEGGLKYSFYVHEGGNYEDIQIKYSGMELALNEQGELTIQNEDHTFLDHAPQSFLEDQILESHFVLEGNSVRFSVPEFDGSGELIIDPWLVTDLPAEFFAYDKAFEIGYDDAGNCVVLGNTSRHVALYDSDGVLQWVWEYLEVIFSTGDLATNPVTGDIFFPVALGGPTVKLDVTGAEIDINGFEIGVPAEKWRVKFNESANELILGNGGTSGDSVISRLSEDFLLEEDYEVLPAPLSEIRDVVFLDIDPDGTAIYFSIAAEVYFPGDSPYDNLLYKVDYDNPNLVIWEQPTAFEFTEVESVMYAPELTYKTNGFNGMACGENFLYTYDGRDIRRIDKMTGAFIDGYTIVENSSFFQAGIDTDECNNLYVGTTDSILVFSETLELMGGIELPGACCDLVVANGVIYACGDGFVGQFELFGEGLYANVSSEPATCEGCNGTATANLESCLGAVADPESVVWSPGGITGETITDLCPGWYVAIITFINEEGEEEVVIDSVEVVSIIEELVVTLEVTDETCEASCNGTVTISPESGDPPYVYTLGAETNGTGFFDELCAGDHEITITDANGCSLDTTITVGYTGTPDPGILVFNHPTCYGFADGSITVNLTDPMGGEVIEIRNPEGDLLNVGGSNTANTLASGWYYYFIDLGDGCVLEDSVELFDPPPIDAVLDVINPPCFGDSTGVVVVDTVFNAQGDYGEIVYIWAPDPEELSGVGADSAFGLPIGDYNLIINDDNGCSRVLEFTLTEPDPLVFVELGFEPAFCRLYGYQNGNGVVYAAASGGIPDYEYEWLNLETGDVSDNSTWGGLNPGKYEITVTDEHGCELVEVIDLDSLNPIAAFTVESDQLDANCEGTELVIANFVNQSQYFADPKDPDADTTFLWNLDYPTANWVISHDFFEEFDSSYVGEDIYQVCLIALNKNGCADTTCKDLIVHVKPEFVAPNIFTPGNGGANDLFTFEFLTLGIAEFHCEIVNRWGVTVGEINDIAEGWDGTNKNGEDCPDGVYFYVYTAVATNKTVFTGQGTVQLVR